MQQVPQSMQEDGEKVEILSLKTFALQIVLISFLSVYLQAEKQKPYRMMQWKSIAKAQQSIGIWLDRSEGIVIFGTIQQHGQLFLIFILIGQAKTGQNVMNIKK